MIKINCDFCESDLSITSNAVDYKLVLKNELIPSEAEAVTLKMVHPILERNKHFCGIDCLKRWVDVEGWAEY